ncbi:MAG: hypothetical protein GY804_03595 [Alphaproteobacteria bacterium]|nr:hypothetical protein [Alphaproteobacteria bacterium]
MKRLLIVLVLVMVGACATKEPPKLFISQLNWDKWDPEHKHCPKSIYDVRFIPHYWRYEWNGNGALQITPKKFIWEYPGIMAYEYYKSFDGMDGYIFSEEFIAADGTTRRGRFIAIKTEFDDFGATDCNIKINFCSSQEELDVALKGNDNCRSLSYRAWKK